jgi:hypothetical protein
MNKHIILLTSLLLLVGTGYSRVSKSNKWSMKSVRYEFIDYAVAPVVLSEDELKLYRLIMEYRKEHGKPEIPLSKAMIFVSQTHAGDLNNNYTLNYRCNAHSWSKKGNWSPCCYTKDHANAEYSWNKPKELTTYAGDGFEIVYMDNGIPTPQEALEKWKKNPTNNGIILNNGQWENVTWNAIGIGMYGEFATVWFGKLPDKDSEPGILQK